MNRFLPILGVICCSIVLTGFFSPWLELYSSPYNLGEARVEDHVMISGWDLSRGRIRVVQMIESQERLRWEYYMTVELQVESKLYPFLCLIGGVLLLAGGMSAAKLDENSKAAYLIIFSGGAAAFIGGVIGFLDNKWITPRVIIIEEYAVFGYYRYGLLLCIIGSLLSIIGCLIAWGISRSNAI